MKSIEYPIVLDSKTSHRITKSINKKVVYYSLLIATAIGGVFFPLLFIAFGMISIDGFSLYCHNLYKEILALDFSSDKYSIFLEEIIEDLER